jgi:hypothetical protein
MNVSADQAPNNKLIVGVVQWSHHDELGIQNFRSILSAGHEAVNLFSDARISCELDAVFLYGPFGSLVPLVNQLLSYPLEKRPIFIWWLTEQLPNPHLPDWVLFWGGRLRSQVERLAYYEASAGEWRLKSHLRWITSKAIRFRYFGDLCWLRQRKVLDLLVTSSPWKAEYLRNKGFNPYVPPNPTYRPEWGKDLRLERDIPVLWLGKIATSRRKRALKRVRKDLEARGVEVLVVDGEENPYIFGEDRTRLLNRTKIMVNLLREKWDNHAARFALAAQNRALIITEPTLPHTSFRHAEHLIQVPIEQMADEVCYYLSHEEERQRIAESAYQFIMKNSREEIISNLLQQVILLRNFHAASSKFPTSEWKKAN